MDIFLQVLFCSLIGGAFSLVGGIILAFTNKGRSFATYATAFAAGALLAAAFVDMLPEALEGSDDPHPILLYAMGGLVFFFLLEGTINWFHNHSHKVRKTHPVVPMIVLGDTIHNFIDGVAIAAGFLISPASGIIVTLAVAVHELPQEIGDFAIMLDKGVKRSKVLLLNILSSLATTVAAVIFFVIGSNVDISLAPLIAVVAGFFIYIAATDIIPTIHQDEQKKEVLKKSALLVLGLVLVSFMITQLHSVIDEHSGHEHEHSHSHAETCLEDEHEEHDDHEHE
ncbi:MAG: ZIP family metal transporter [Candidatus Nomurabacteria bacterium]|nr:ZIP family metal transporter [Candidatus Nomurabacteria bacterium]